MDLKDFLKQLSTNNPITIQVSDDSMIAFVPKGSPFGVKFLSWSYQEFLQYLRSLRIVLEPSADEFQLLQQQAKLYPKGLPMDFVVVQGIYPQEGLPMQLTWLNEPPLPKDMCQAGKPFLHVQPPTPPLLGTNVYGEVVYPSGYNPKAIEQHETHDGLIIGEPFLRQPDGSIVSSLSGQVTLKDKELEFSDTYIIRDPSRSDLQVAVFYCNVLVKSDLVGDMRWEIHGDLTVEGHWSASNIVVYGNAIALSGIQTNMNGVLKIYGNLRTTYIQFTKIGIAKDVLVETSIVQSEVRIGGNLVCKGEPGAIVGSDIVCFGAIIANRVGSDKGRKTKIRVRRYPDVLNPPKTKIGLLCQGTRMQVYEEIWTQREDAPYES